MDLCSHFDSTLGGTFDGTILQLHCHPILLITRWQPQIELESSAAVETVIGRCKNCPDTRLPARELLMKTARDKAASVIRTPPPPNDPTSATELIMHLLMGGLVSLEWRNAHLINYALRAAIVLRDGKTLHLHGDRSALPSKSGQLMAL